MPLGNEPPHSEGGGGSGGGPRAQHHEEQITFGDLNKLKYLSYTWLSTVALDVPFYPIDVARARLQVQGSSTHNLSFAPYGNMLLALRAIWRKEGRRGLFQGFTINEVGYASAHLMWFAAYEFCKEAFPPFFSNLSPAAQVFAVTSCASLVAELCNSTIQSPFEVASQRLALQGPLKPRAFANGRALLWDVYRTEGIRGLYRGFGASLVKNIPLSVAWWCAYESVKSFLHSVDLRARLHLTPRKTHTLHSAHHTDHVVAERDLEDEDPLIHGIAGVTAATLATVLVNPLDVAKTRLQTTIRQSPSPASPSPSPSSSSPSPSSSSNSPTAPSSSPFHATRPPSMWQTLRASWLRFRATPTIFSVLGTIVREEGVRALSKGLLPNLVIQVPYFCLGIVLYEQVKKWSVNTD